MHRRWIAIPCLLGLLCGPGGDAAAETIGVRIVSRVGDDGAADPRPKRARVDEGVTLHAVLVTRSGDRTVYYSDAGVVRIDGRERRARALDEAPAHVLFWYTVEPAVESLSNHASGRFRFEPIEYAEVPMWPPHVRSRPANVRPRLTPDRGDGVGTMRYALMVATADGVFRTPGARARRGRGSGGLRDTVHRVSLRRDDTYLGYLTELYGQPYIWGSAGRSDARHQSERLEGSDCADFVVYARRRAGHRVPYTWTGGLARHTRLLGRGRADDDGVFRDEDGSPLPFPRPGDLLLFPRHVGAVSADRGRPGVLDTADRMMHTLFESPGEEPIATSGYADRWVEIRRWR